MAFGRGPVRSKAAVGMLMLVFTGMTDFELVYGSEGLRKGKSCSQNVNY